MIGERSEALPRAFGERLARVSDGANFCRHQVVDP
jgi:hypothetical protein